MFKDELEANEEAYSRTWLAQQDAIVDKWQQTGVVLRRRRGGDVGVQKVKKGDGKLDNGSQATRGEFLDAPAVSRPMEGCIMFGISISERRAGRINLQLSPHLDVSFKAWADGALGESRSRRHDRPRDQQRGPSQPARAPNNRNTSLYASSSS